MREKITKKELKEVDVIDKEIITCDCCDKVIFSSKDFIDGIYDNRINTSSGYIKYFTVITGHDDWGNDSVDSIGSNDYCSDDCLEESLKKYLNRYKDSYTAYFKIYSAGIYINKTDRKYGILELEE